MKSRYIAAGILIMVMVISLAASVSAEATRVAVIGFESEDSDWTDDEDREIELLEEIAWQFNDKLAETDDYAVLNRDKMLDVLEETRFSQGKRPSHSIINQLRNQIDADLFAYGTLKEINVKEVDRFKLGPVKLSEVTVTVDLGLEMIGAGSGRVENSYTGSGEVDESGVEFDDDDQIYTLSDDILERAVEKAVDNLIENMGEESPPAAPAEKTVEAEVTAIIGDRLVVNKGEEDGLEVGQSGKIVRFENDSRKDIGEIEVTEVDRESAFLETIYLNREPESGDKAIITFEENVRDERSFRRPLKNLVL
ncbi:hypothetical protein [Halarsenatibacter silvermanii]|uniref:Curli production assembly/transport component CsgG n=1 Tax=Halarsenatibacter silvermanii TaxID=321763 RepID=A0A1G9TIR1_9FIRM|nr:hypothetical protein [Halarsenatibacter silvermanii]SDM47540.1 hypothetical protein SAMN04488692_14010 [Halarsenatibacter silvermanii]